MGMLRIRVRSRARTRRIVIPAPLAASRADPAAGIHDNIPQAKSQLGERRIRTTKNDDRRPAVATARCSRCRATGDRFLAKIISRMVAWGPACDAFGIVAFRDAGMTSQKTKRHLFSRSSTGRHRSTLLKLFFEPKAVAT